MTRISRDVPHLDMKRRSKKHGLGNNMTQGGIETHSRSGSSASGNGNPSLNSTARDPSEQVLRRKETSSNLTHLPDISHSISRNGFIRNKSSVTPRPKLQRSRTESFHNSSGLRRHIVKLHSVNEFSENLLARKKDSNTSSQGISDSVSSILERTYHNDLDELGCGLGYKTHTPYFSKWKISGFRHDKVILTSVTSMSETQEVTPEFVQYIKERDSAVEDAKKAQSELRETQCKLYDSMLLIEELEKKLNDAEMTQKPTKASSKKTTATKKKKAGDTSSIKGSTLSVRGNTSVASSGISSGRTSFVSSSKPADGGLYHPPVLNLEPVADSREFYWKLAEKFPTLPMFQVLDAEKKFIKADTDNSGYIDKAELDKVLSDSVGLFTPAQLDAIFEEIDLDQSETVDFYEVLFVLNKLYSRRRTNLPQSVQQNYSKTCNVQ